VSATCRQGAGPSCGRNHQSSSPVCMLTSVTTYIKRGILTDGISRYHRLISNQFFLPQWATTSSTCGLAARALASWTRVRRHASLFGDTQTQVLD